MFKKLLVYSNNNILVQFFRYVITGGIASAVDILVFNIGIYLLHTDHIAANTVSFVFGLITSYYLSRRWVFGKKEHVLKRDLSLYALVGVIGLLISDAILFILVNLGTLHVFIPFAGEDMIKLSAKLIAVALVLLWNFWARKKFVFNRDNEL